ncbi:Uncharacterised protein (plasmid) [Legionella adelaidensis]|uniref:Uncharacterized protein n=1 Tax=Legionella adelaidensis TaxID=45056 RepID=A0A0W0R1R1_9GAMM|nr:hypothetical protein [Legionella adelaidensis]KTC65015.1 hypothetical protein Lade_1695 [Legionella adelaidensis]VEH85305.1 Uncharacterised protein [Legionella adelaidensis]
MRIDFSEVIKLNDTVINPAPIHERMAALIADIPISPQQDMVLAHLQIALSVDGKREVFDQALSLGVDVLEIPPISKQQRTGPLKILPSAIGTLVRKLCMDDLEQGLVHQIVKAVKDRFPHASIVWHGMVIEIHKKLDFADGEAAKLDLPRVFKARELSNEHEEAAAASVQPAIKLTPCQRISTNFTRELMRQGMKPAQAGTPILCFFRLSCGSPSPIISFVSGNLPEEEREAYLKQYTLLKSDPLMSPKKEPEVAKRPKGIVAAREVIQRPYGTRMFDIGQTGVRLREKKPSGPPEFVLKQEPPKPDTSPEKSILRRRKAPEALEQDTVPNQEAKVLKSQERSVEIASQTSLVYLSMSLSPTPPSAGGIFARTQSSQEDQEPPRLQRRPTGIPK